MLPDLAPLSAPTPFGLLAVGLLSFPYLALSFRPGRVQSVPLSLAPLPSPDESFRFTFDSLRLLLIPLGLVRPAAFPAR